MINKHALIRNLLSESIKESNCVGVMLSGGLDSTILLHHLREKLPSHKIMTFTADFRLKNNKYLDVAKEVAEYYKTVHYVVNIPDFIPDLPIILKDFEHPRWNVWIWYIAKEMEKQGIKNAYIGEGLDEHFGGYISKPYLKAWSDHFVYIMPTYKQIFKQFNIKLHAPFDTLMWQTTFEYYTPPNKQFIREAYKGLIPENVINSRKEAPVFSTSYLELYEKHNWSRFYPNYIPRTDNDVRRLLKNLATQAWLGVNVLE